MNAEKPGPIRFSVKKSDKVVLLEFELERPLEPKDLKHINPPDAVKNKFANKLVILSGRGPIWLYAYLIEFYHPVKAIATFDPRIGKAIVVSSHSPDYSPGDLIDIPD